MTRATRQTGQAFWHDRALSEPLFMGSGKGSPLSIGKRQHRTTVAADLPLKMAGRRWIAAGLQE
jgi:hypothetical protein